MILSAQSIRKLCDSSTKSLISPYYEEFLQPASYDVSLGKIEYSNFPDGYLILPHEFVLASTVEYFKIPDYLVGRVEGKSTRARQGIIIHAAGFIDPGFKGQITLEITNLSSHPVYLKYEDKIAQVAFHMLDEPSEFVYGSERAQSHYQGQLGPTRAWNE